jgi:hypothetical protein
LDFLMTLDDGRIPVPVEYLVDTVPSKEVAELVMERSGLAVHPRSHVVGNWTNMVFSGVHAGAAAKARGASVYSFYNPQWFGHKHPMVIGDGKYQGSRGKANIGAMEAYSSEMIVTMEDTARKVADLGMSLPDEDAIEQVTIAINTRAVEAERPIADSEIEAIVAEMTGEQIEDTVTGYEFSSTEDRGESYAEVFLDVAGKSDVVSSHAETDSGAVDAGVQSINEALGFNGDIAKLVLISLESSSAASAGVLLTIVENGHRFTAYGTGRSENEASLDAYINGYNMIQRVKARQA